MRPPPFEYESVGSAEEAAGRLAALGEDAKIVAGGQSLVPLLALRLARPSALVDIDRAGGMDHVAVDAHTVRVGALVRHRRVAGDSLLHESLPLLAEAARLVGHNAIRNRGTLGGSLAHADPAAELPAAAMALDATVIARSVRGRRRVPAAELFLGFLTTALAPDEVLEEVEFPVPARGTGWAFEEFSRRHGDFAVAAVAVTLTTDQGSTVTDARVVLAGVDSIPVRAHDAEAVLRGVRADGAAWEDVAEAAARPLSPPEDLHGTSAYRRHLIRVLLRRALATAAERAAGGVVRSETTAGRPAAPSLTSGGAALPPTAATGAGPRTIELDVNGRHYISEVEPRSTLAALLREGLGLTGTHVACEHGVCGACTVLLDGTSVRSCLVLAMQARGRAVTTIEGLGTPESMHPLQRGCLESHSFQCGFCTPGFLMSASELLEERPFPTEREVRSALSGHICRCTGYQSIVAGVLAAAGKTRRTASPGEAP